MNGHRPAAHSCQPGALSPPGSTYATVDQLSKWGWTLADSQPDRFRLREYGRSRAGEPLQVLSLGEGARQVLVVAGPHAGEPISGTTLPYLIRKLTGPGGHRALKQATWHLVLCADPDSARLNEGWLSGPFTMAAAHRHFFRPAFAEQPEWLQPPSASSPPLPESAALVELIDQLRPALQCSLHGLDIGGTYLQLTRDLPGVAHALAASAQRHGIPLVLGGADAPDWPTPGPGVYVMPSNEADRFIALPDNIAVSTWTYAERHGTVTAIIEVPMWAADAVADLDPHPAAEAALARSRARLRGNSLRIAKLLEHARPHLATSSSNLLRAVEETLTISMQLADEWDPEVRPAEARPLPEPTIARVARVRTVAHRLPLRAAAMLQRLVSADQAPGGHSRAGQLTLVQQELNHFVAQGCSDFASALGARWIPVPDQAEHQASMVLASFDSLVG